MGEIRMTRDFFLWCMSVMYLFAFASLYVQIPGLYGDSGILPVRLVLGKEAESFSDLLSFQPTLLRMLPKLGLDTETSLDFLCLAGIVLSFVAMISKRQRNTITFFLLWTFYFSFFQVGQTFLWFQWDILLLEVGFLCVLLAPFNLFGLKASVHHHHDMITFWLIKWLLFRLMFASGVVKLQSNCPTWWGLTALNYHYETQCIPAPLAWYAHQFPEWFQKLCVASVFVIQIPIPFLFFSPVRSQRIFAFFAQVLLMFTIILTGNYNFFNWMTNALCLCLVDDNFLRTCLGHRNKVKKGSSIPVIGTLRGPLRWIFNFVVYGVLTYWTVKLFSLRVQFSPFMVHSATAFNSQQLTQFLQVAVPISIWIGVLSLAWQILKAIYASLTKESKTGKKVYSLAGCLVFGTIAFSMFGISLVPFTKIERRTESALPPTVYRLHSYGHAYRLSSPYGLFRRMTGVGGRPEVIVEGSDAVDGEWTEYNFLYKPGNVSAPLGINVPHQPRLDWQMWFAALGNYQRNTWFLNLVYRLLNNQKEVLELMDENPFPKSPPKYIRASLYHYYYTRMDKKHQWYSAKDWWVRKYIREYLPVVSLDEESYIKYLEQSGIYKDFKEKKSEKGNVLRRGIRLLRSYVGQPDGFRACMSLFLAGLTLTFIDPAVKLRRIHVVAAFIGR